jgi:hypothetical protein
MNDVAEIEIGPQDAFDRNVGAEVVPADLDQHRQRTRNNRECDELDGC